MAFFDAFVDEFNKIALDLSADPKKMIMMKQFEGMNKETIQAVIKEMQQRQAQAGLSTGG